MRVCVKLMGHETSYVTYQEKVRADDNRTHEIRKWAKGLPRL